MRVITFFGLFLSISCLSGIAQAGGVSSGLLTSSCWCSFKYNKVTGYSNTTKYCFRPNGACSTGSRGEGYSSGGGGLFGSQHDSAGGCRWKVAGGELYMAEPGENFDLVQTVVKNNSNGAPIIVGDGVEYSQCN